MAYYPVDLHTHTTASDGAYSPTQVVERTVDRGLRVVGIADHDTIEGLTEALTAGERLGIEVVPAVEFSLRHEPDKHFVGLHLLGYFIDPQTPVLIDVMKKVQQGRIDQKIKQIEILQSFGFDVPVDEVFARATGMPGRPHIATVLMERNPGRFKSINQIFDEYLGVHAKAHVGRQFALKMAEATEIIKQAGGVPVFAHPGGYGTDIDPITAVRNAQADGVEGVEVFYPYEKGHRSPSKKSSWIARTETLARELDLLQSGGTDFHGRPHDVIDLGDMGLSEEQFAAFKQGWQRLRANTR